MRLAQVQTRGGSAAHVLRQLLHPDHAPPPPGLSAPLLDPDFTGQAARVTAATGLRPLGSVGLRAIDGERLAVRILLVKYRRLREAMAERAEASARVEKQVSGRCFILWQHLPHPTHPISGRRTVHESRRR
jgi:hypothetical protein